MKKLIPFLLLGMFVSQGILAEQINILNAGGKNDGKTSNTVVIRKLINKLSANGGGTLYFPAGVYKTGPIELKSNITLDLESGAVISFSDYFEDYLPFVEIRYEGIVMKSFHPLIYSYEAENITIKGRGTLDGNGRLWWNAHNGFKVSDAKNEPNIEKYSAMWNEANKDLLSEYSEDLKGYPSRRFFRPPFFQAYRSKNILIEGVKFTNSPFWTITPTFCSNIRVTGVTIDNPISPNTDGIDPSSCNNVHISDCHINVGDDCITIKSGKDNQGRKYNVPCENLTITNCTMLAGHGGVVIGSEMSGSVRKVVISNCVFDGTDRGIRIKSTRGRGGIVEDIRVSNIVMRNITQEAITLNTYYTRAPQEPVSEKTPIFRNIHFSNITGVDVNKAALVVGLPEMPLSDISFNDIDLQSKTGFVIRDAKNVSINGVTVSADEGPAFIVDKVSDLRITDIRTQKPEAANPVLSVSEAKDIFIRDCYPLAGSSSFLKVEGKDCEGIVMSGNCLTRLQKPLDIPEDLKKAVIVE